MCATQLPAFVAELYDNSVALLTDSGHIQAPTTGLPPGVRNPLDKANTDLRVWSRSDNDDFVGLLDRRVTPQVTPTSLLGASDTEFMLC